MKKLIYIIIALFLVSCGSSKTADITSDSPIVAGSSHATVASILSNMGKGTFKDNELLVKFKPGVLRSTSSSVHRSAGASMVKSFDIIPDLEHIKLPEGMSVSDAVIQYMSDPNVEYAEPNYEIHVLSTFPNDIYFDQLYGLHNTGTYANGSADADIDAPEAWDVTTGSDSVTVAVNDTGIDYDHADLVGNIWTNEDEDLGDANGDTCPGVCGVDDDGDGLIDEDSSDLEPGDLGYSNDLVDDDDENGYVDDLKGWDFANDDNDPIDDNGHGTHVSGTIGAVGNNSEGITGVMWNVRLMALKFLGSGGSGTTSDAIDAIEYAVSKGAKVINASYGSSAFSNAELDAIEAANTAGVLLVAAAGNDGENNDLGTSYPASYESSNIIAVAATDMNDERVSFSNYGPLSVDVAAPGVYILSTVLLNSDYGVLDFYAGTSMAAPHVTGLVGLLYSYYNGVNNTAFNHSQVRTTIFRTVDVLSELTGWINTNGRINAYKAVASLRIPTNLTATALSATAVNLTWTDNATDENWYKIERTTPGGSWTQIDTVGPNSTTYTDTGRSASTTYWYRIRAANDLPADSFYSATAGAVTNDPPTAEGDDTPKPSKGKGGNCSIGARQNTPTALAGIAVMLLPFVFIAVIRLKRKYRN